MSEDHVDVVIAGAGPNGLMLARELALAGVHPLVLDQLAGPSAEPKANGLVGQVIRSLDMRGLYHEMGGAPGAPVPIPGFLFSGIPMSFHGVADNPMHALLIPQPRLVRLLEKQVRDAGVSIRWGHEVTGLTRHDGHVALTVVGPNGSYDLTAQYLVGADGGHSRVRKCAGIEFSGATTDVVTRLAHVSIPDELHTPGGWFEVPGFGPMPFGHTRFDNGMCVFAAFEDGRQLIGTMEFGPTGPDEGPVTLDEVRDSVRRVLGVDVPLAAPQGAGPHALRRINGQQTRQADRYRVGNVFLVGDAAHVHSAMGGPGLNLGLQDAVNLGWKLAATVNGWAPADLLDTYHRERHPVGEQVMISSLSQTALMAPGAEVTALRALFGELVKERDTAARLAHTLAGSDVRYDVGDAHPLSGRLVPELTLPSGQRVAELLHAARPLLLDFAGGVFAPAIENWRDRVDVIVEQPAAVTIGPPAPAAAILVRPDGYVAWAADAADSADVDHLRDAASRWFGSAVRSPADAT
jgi:2-polyprenyl-6-methoxyphenol hydroxylase-like FAD-dependent oxidoreductase